MAKLLPNIQVADDQFDALVGVFGDADTYKTWLKTSLRNEVRRVKNNARISTDNAARAVAVDAEMVALTDIAAPEPDPEP
tara:strand:- start:828 stop:1067 length:240 start_codon:yes stop_codon:yes gene_type:complete